eukprot:TRINITY_DN4360_c0_g1_i3.p1 TRINITY_DN4360_c0_g1~~TRINITY_DN4360_c0_g1_i3.p1  ORF type:complete len:329 (+),score=58.83 TRINITY_DN4360_c0_g1_i3:62-1048(+)
MSLSTLIIDNGSATCKAAIVGDQPRVMPNLVGKSKSDKLFYIADGVDDCKDPSSLVLRSPFEKGYLVNWEVEKDVWDRIFTIFSVKHSETNLVITQAPLNPASLQKMVGEVVFEEYGFPSLIAATASFYAHNCPSLKKPFPGYGIVVDSGYSFTHIIPFENGRVINSGIKRINVGGKLLTNYLKEIVSYRHWNMMEETLLVNRIKEKTCYVSMDFNRELRTPKGRNNPLRMEYVLPDYRTSTYGYVKGVDPEPENRSGDEQILPLTNERITIPELLFHPSDIGIPQAGIPEAIIQSVQSTPESIHGLLYSNIVLIGGNTRFPNFKMRL